MTRDYTHPSVLKGIAEGAPWADPIMDPAEIDWAPRQARAAIPFKVVNGRPVNPCESTGIRFGRNEFGHWGEALMADMVLFLSRGAGERHLLMVERRDGHGWALPGGHVEPGETGVAAALRELREETGLSGVQPEFCEELPARYVPDPRASDEAWAVTIPVRAAFIHPRAAGPLPAVTGWDDARRAEWVRADNYETLTADLAGRFGGRVFAAHEAMLREFLGPVT